MLNTAKLYSQIPVWLILTVTRGQRVTGKWELVQSFFYKMAWSNPKVCDGSLCKGVDCKEVLWVWRALIIWAFALLVGRIYQTKNVWTDLNGLLFFSPLKLCVGKGRGVVLFFGVWLGGGGVFVFFTLSILQICCMFICECEFY